MTPAHAETPNLMPLLQPVTLRGLTLRNRVVMLPMPMAMYSAAERRRTDFHLVHLGRFALGGAGPVFMEPTAVNAAGRITGCPGVCGAHANSDKPEFRPGSFDA